MNMPPVAITLCTVMLLGCLWSPNVMAHPTNGYECTTITDPVRCFNSDGFCEWVSARCLYRCDIHDGLEDCGQIKEGCHWNGSACTPDPINSDQDTGPEMDMPDAAAFSDDVFIEQTIVDRDLPFDAMIDIRPPSNAVFADMDVVQADPPPSPSCHQSVPSGRGFMLFVIGAVIWRRSRCL